MRKMLEYINISSFTIYISWIILPVTRENFRGGIWNILAIGSLIIWGGTVLLLKSNTFSLKRSSFYLIYLIIWLLIYLLYAFIGYGTDNVDHLEMFMSFWSFVFIFAFYKYYLTIKDDFINIIVSTIGTLLFITYITTLIGLMRYPNAIRTISHTGNNYYSSLNIGGYDFLYALVLLIPLYVFLIKDEYISKFKRIKYVAIIIGLILLAFLSNFLTALIFSIVGLTLGVYLTKDEISKVTFLYYMFSIIIMMAIMLIPISAYKNLLIIIISQLQDGFIRVRFLEIYTFINSYSLTGSSLLRQELVNNSWNSFLSSPLYGVGGIYYNNTYLIGAHSQWIDDLGRYGIIGIVPLVLFFKYYLKSTLKMYSRNTLKKAYFCTFFLFILLGFINPTTSRLTIGIVIFLYAPLKIKLYDINTEKKGNVS